MPQINATATKVAYTANPLNTASALIAKSGGLQALLMLEIARSYKGDSMFNVFITYQEGSEVEKENAE